MLPRRARNAQAAGGAAGFLDADHALDPVYARKFGVDVDNRSSPIPPMAQALEIARHHERARLFRPFDMVVDSVAALAPKAGR